MERVILRCGGHAVLADLFTRPEIVPQLRPIRLLECFCDRDTPALHSVGIEGDDEIDGARLAFDFRQELSLEAQMIDGAVFRDVQVVMRSVGIRPEDLRVFVQLEDAEGVPDSNDISIWKKLRMAPKVLGT